MLTLVSPVKSQLLDYRKPAVHTWAKNEHRYAAQKADMKLQDKHLNLFLHTSHSILNSFFGLTFLICKRKKLKKEVENKVLLLKHCIL